MSASTSQTEFQKWSDAYPTTTQQLFKLVPGIPILVARKATIQPFLTYDKLLEAFPGAAIWKETLWNKRTGVQSLVIVWGDTRVDAFLVTDVNLTQSKPLSLSSSPSS